MAQSDTEICNLALSYIGEKPIGSLAERPRGLDCNLIYTATRDALIREFPWNFAVRRHQPALLTSTPLFEYDYQFRLPTDCLRIWRLFTDTDGTEYTGRWHPETDDAGHLLLANVDELYIQYMARITRVGLYPASFVIVLARRLAADLALPIGKNGKVQTTQFQIYHQVLLSAYADDAIDDGEFPDEQVRDSDSSWVSEGRD